MRARGDLSFLQLAAKLNALPATAIICATMWLVALLHVQHPIRNGSALGDHAGGVGELQEVIQHPRARDVRVRDQLPQPHLQQDCHGQPGRLQPP